MVDDLMLKTLVAFSLIKQYIIYFMQVVLIYDQYNSNPSFLVYSHTFKPTFPTSCAKFCKEICTCMHCLIKAYEQGGLLTHALTCLQYSKQ